METLPFLDWITLRLPALALCMCRTSGFFLLSPLLGRRGVPNMVKAALCLLMSIIAVQVLPPAQAAIQWGGFMFFTQCAKEVATGWVMGYGVSALLSAILIAGQIMDMQVGFSMARMLDAQAGVQAPVIGVLLNLSAVMLFLMTGGHERLIRMFYFSYEAIPLGGAVLGPQLWQGLPGLFMEAFSLAVGIALPIMLTLLMTEIMMGLLARVVPQINFFVVGLPMKIMVGLLVLLAFIPVFVQMLPNLFDRIDVSTQGIMNQLTGR